MNSRSPSPRYGIGKKTSLTWPSAFLDNANNELSKQVKGFSETALNTLFAYNWPGNVRQLRSIIRRAALLADDLITEKHLELKRVPVPGLAFTPNVQKDSWK